MIMIIVIITIIIVIIVFPNPFVQPSFLSCQVHVFVSHPPFRRAGLSVCTYVYIYIYIYMLYILYIYILCIHYAYIYIYIYIYINMDTWRQGERRVTRCLSVNGSCAVRGHLPASGVQVTPRSSRDLNIWATAPSLRGAAAEKYRRACNTLRMFTSALEWRAAIFCKPTWLSFGLNLSVELHISNTLQTLLVSWRILCLHVLLFFNTNNTFQGWTTIRNMFERLEHSSDCAKPLRSCRRKRQSLQHNMVDSYFDVGTTCRNSLQALLLLFVNFYVY